MLRRQSAGHGCADAALTEYQPHAVTHEALLSTRWQVTARQGFLYQHAGAQPVAGVGNCRFGARLEVQREHYNIATGRGAQPALERFGRDTVGPQQALSLEPCQRLQRAVPLDDIEVVAVGVHQDDIDDIGGQALQA